MYKVLGIDRQVYGPATEWQLRQWITEGRVNADTFIQREGAAEWKPLRAFPEFSSALGLNAATPQIIAPNLIPAAYGRSSNGLATAGMIMGILSMSIGWFCCGFGPLFSILGLTFSCVGLSQINQNPERYTGRSVAITGIILSALALVMHIAFAMLFGFVHSFGRALSRMR